MEEFTQICEEYPIVLQPATTIKHIIQKNILGNDFWTKKTLNRTEEFGELTSAEDILLRKRKEKYMQEFQKEVDAKAEASMKKAVGLKKKKPKKNKVIDDAFQGLDVEIEDEQDDEKDSDDSDKDDNDNDDDSDAGSQDSDSDDETNASVVEYKHLMEEYEQFEENYKNCGKSTEQEMDRRARLKNQLQLCVNKLSDVSSKRFEVKKARAYKRAIDKTNAKAQDFFSDKEGKNYLRIVGKEHAIREFNPRFGILSKVQREFGEKKAYDQYVARKAKEITSLVKEKYEARNHERIKEIKRMFATHGLYTTTEVSYIHI